MGECARCGECCKWVEVPLDDYPTNDELMWMDYHGIRVEERMRPCKGGKYERFYLMMIPCMCRMLREDPTYGYRCFLKTEDQDLRPQNCKDNPQYPWQHPNACKYFSEGDG